MKNEKYIQCLKNLLKVEEVSIDNDYNRGLYNRGLYDGLKVALNIYENIETSLEEKIMEASIISKWIEKTPAVFI
jgi:hypothetical protein